MILFIGFYLLTCLTFITTCCSEVGHVQLLKPPPRFFHVSSLSVSWIVKSRADKNPELMTTFFLDLLSVRQTFVNKPRL